MTLAKVSELGKAGKGKTKSGNKSGSVADVAGEIATKVEIKNDVQKGAVQEQVTQLAEKPSNRSFDISAYIQSMAWVFPVALILLMVLMFYIRAVPSHDNVFTTWADNYVNFAADDAVLQMRLVHNTLAHFPDRIFFEAFTHYPYGSAIHFGPVFTLIIASASLILGLGSPTIAQVDWVGAYTPAVLGTLCLIPTYFIARKMFGRKVGLVSALTLSVIPGAFLVRSMLGFTDHHIAEVLFSITTVMFLVYALDAAKASKLDFGKLRAFDRGIMSTLAYSLLAGISFGVYMLTWSGGLLIGMVFFIYFGVQIVVDYLKDKSIDYLVIISAVTFLLPAIMLLPYSLQNLQFELLYYSLTQPFFLGLAFAGIGATYAVSYVLKSNKAEAWTFPVVLLGMGIIGLILTYVLMPQIYGLIMAGFGVFTISGGMSTVGEARPTYLNSSGEFTLDTFWGSFFWAFPIAILGIFLLALRVFKDNRPAEWLFFIWNLIMLWATISQNRFTYYFAINAALLTGYVVMVAFKALDWDRFAENWKKRVKNYEDATVFIGKNAGQVATFAVIGLVSLAMIIYPATSLSTGVNIGKVITGQESFFNGYTEAYSLGGAGTNNEWYSTLLWMRTNTPDPQGSVVSESLDYANGTYKKPADGTLYPYPSSAYGVMSWWDYGHMITYIAHRIPNANPFQAGIIENNGTGGASKFFLATSEDTGYKNLQNLGSRYVVIDNEMATGKFYAITVWVDDEDGWYTEKEYAYGTSKVTLTADSQKFKNSMLNRLYYDDCNNMSHFRLVYESPGDYYITIKYMNTDSGSITPYASTSTSNFTKAYNLYETAIGIVPNDESSIVYDARSPQKYVKVFETVKGATITGKAEPGTSVTAKLNLSVNDKTFQYARTGIADQTGTYSLTVSYPTEAMKGADYTYAVMPEGKYTITAGNTTATVDVPERAVMNGETVTVP